MPEINFADPAITDRFDVNEETEFRPSPQPNPLGYTTVGVRSSAGSSGFRILFFACSLMLSRPSSERSIVRLPAVRTSQDTTHDGKNLFDVLLMSGTPAGGTCFQRYLRGSCRTRFSDQPGEQPRSTNRDTAYLSGLM